MDLHHSDTGTNPGPCERSGARGRLLLSCVCLAAAFDSDIQHVGHELSHREQNPKLQKDPTTKQEIPENIVKPETKHKPEGGKEQ